MDDYITVEELRQLLHVSRTTAYRVADRVPHVRIGRALRVSRRGLDAYMRAHDYAIPLDADEPWRG